MNRSPHQLPPLWRVLTVLLVGALFTPALVAAPATETVATPASGATAAPTTDQTPAALTLTPAEAAALALRNSLQLRRHATSVQQAEARLRQAQTQSNATTSASAYSSWTTPTPAAIRSLTEGITVTLTKPLYTGRRVQTQTELARRNVDVAGAQAPVTASDLTLNAYQQIYNILRLEQLAGVSSQDATTVAEHLRVTKAMEAQGTVANFEVVQAETRLAQAKGDIISAQTRVQQAYAELARLLTLPQTTQLTAREGVPLPVPDATLTDLLTRAWGQRPEMALAERELRAAEASLRVIHHSTDVQVNLVASANQETASMASEPVNVGVSVSLTKPLSDGGLRRAQEQEQQAAIDDVKLQIDSIKNDISLNVRQAILSVAEAREQLRVAEAGETNAREQLRLAQIRYAAGLTTGVEVLDAETALASAETSTVNARYDLQTAVVELHQAVGDLTALELGAP